MKKKWFIVLYIVLGVVTAFGQDAVGTSTDSKIVTEQAATTDRDQADGAVVPAQATGAEALSSQENTVITPKNDFPASVSADNGGAYELLPAKAILPNLPLIRIPVLPSPKVRRRRRKMLKTNRPALRR